MDPKTTKNLDATMANHELLVSIGKDVVAQNEALKNFTQRVEDEFKKIWRHVESSSEKQAQAVSAIGDKFNTIGRPNVVNIVVVLTFIGTIAVAFISPIKTDQARSEHSSEILAQAVLDKERRIQLQQTDLAMLATKVTTNKERLDDLQANGTAAARERLAVLESDLKWMRGEKKTRPCEGSQHENHP